jgi:excisionase family DNA binding protein
MAAPSEGPSPQGTRIFDAINNRVTALRLLYPQIHGVDVDLLFLAFLLETAHFGVFSFGPITLDVQVVEDLFARTSQARPGEPHRISARARDFYARLGQELERAGTRHPNELHYLLAFMRSPEGLPHRVFSELGVSPEAVERFARGRTSPAGRTDVFLSPEDVAERLGVNVQTVRAWIRSGKLPASRLAGRRVLRVREADIERVLEPVDPSGFNRD